MMNDTAKTEALTLANPNPKFPNPAPDPNSLTLTPIPTLTSSPTNPILPQVLQMMNEITAKTPGLRHVRA